MARISKQKQENVKTGYSKKFQESEISRMIDQINPLKGLTAVRAFNIRDIARNGNQAQLQRIYEEIEKSESTIIAGMRLRMSSISERSWSIVVKNENDTDIAKEQLDYISKQMSNIKDLNRYIEALALANFRGYAALNPKYSDNEMTNIIGFDIIPQQNMVYSKKFNKWLWNANGDVTSFIADEERITDLQDGITYINNLPVIPEDEMIILQDNTPIDYAILEIFLRICVGNTYYGKFMERFSIPNMILTMPEYIKSGEEGYFYESVQDMIQGASGVVPYGTNVSYSAEARGNSPFQDFIHEQQRQLARLIVGSELMLIPESGSGTLAGSVHKLAFDKIINRDCKKISETITSQLIDKLIQRKFNKESLVSFKIDEEKIGISDLIEYAKSLYSIGLKINKDEIQSVLGFTLDEVQVDVNNATSNDEIAKTEL